MVNVLVVEDNPVNRRLVQILLERAGHTPALATNGQEALALLEKQKFDVVLMDIQMPVMDGLTATRAIRASGKEYATIPVIALTAHALDEHRELCKAAGMDAFVCKPIQTATLFSEIARLTGTPPAVSPSTAAH